MIRLKDGRLCVTYGDRKAPFEMQAKFSSDEGKTWSEPFVLITETGGRDMGYPKKSSTTGRKNCHHLLLLLQGLSYRKVMATIWDPGTPD